MLIIITINYKPIPKKQNKMITFELFILECTYAWLIQSLIKADAVYMSATHPSSNISPQPPDPPRSRVIHSATRMPKNTMMVPWANLVDSQEWLVSVVWSAADILHSWLSNKLATSSCSIASLLCFFYLSWVDGWMDEWMDVQAFRNTCGTKEAERLKLMVITFWHSKRTTMKMLSVRSNLNDYSNN